MQSFLNFDFIIIIIFHMTTSKYIFLSVFTIATLQSCKDTSNTSLDQPTKKIAYNLKGTSFNKTNILTTDELTNIYNNLSVNDSVNLTFKGKIHSVCKAKGCWITVALENNKEVVIKFKDYGFFVPTDSNHREVIVHGKAFLKEISVNEQQHNGKDAGLPEVEINRITSPKLTYSFLADGILVEQAVLNKKN